MSKTLIAFFTYSGNTRLIAERIQELSEGDLFEIRTKEPYPENYRASVDQSKKELAENARPVLSDSVEDFSSYEKIVLGYPNWCGTMPMPVWTFLEQYDFSGKQIYPYCSHGSGRVARSQYDLETLCPDARVKECLSIYGRSFNDAFLREWLQK